MTDLLRPVMELSILFPGILIAYLPVKSHLKWSVTKLTAALAPLAALLCCILGAICYHLEISTLWVLFPIIFIFSIFYIYSINMSFWKSISIILAICAAFSCLGNVAKAINLFFYPDNTDLWLSTEASLIYIVMCWTLVLVCWYPAAHAVRTLLEDEAFARTWYVFWILPILFIGLNLYMMPLQPDIMQQGRLIQLYITFSMTLLVLLLLFYAMFYLMAASLNHNDRLRQENQFLSMQQAQYHNLQIAIEETRSARHDMHHHFNTLQNLAGRGEWEALTDYLSEAQSTVPDTLLNLCEHPAVDSVASHYAILCRKSNIPFYTQFDLPRSLPVSEMDFCLVLSNLLENALEASLKTKPDRRNIKVKSYLHSDRIILLTVENTYDGVIKEKNGIIQSSKRIGSGVGTQSVRRIAEKNGGYCHFTYDNGIFCANIMLR